MTKRIAIVLLAAVFNASVAAANCNVTRELQRYEDQVNLMSPDEKSGVLQNLEAWRDGMPILFVVSIVCIPALLCWGYGWRCSRQDKRRFRFDLRIVRDWMFWVTVAALCFCFWAEWHLINEKIRIVRKGAMDFDGGLK